MLFANNTIHSQSSESNIAHHMFHNKHIVAIICTYHNTYRLYTYNELCVKHYVNHEMIDPELSLIFHILSA